MKAERELPRLEGELALEATGIAVELGRREIVRDISLTVPAGSWTCVIGPNGAGKTTLIHAIAGVVPRRGEVRLWGRAFAELGRRERARRVALVPQLPTIPDGITVGQYVLLGRTPHLGILAAEGRRDREAVADALERLDLVWARERRVDTLSGGELRRVLLARALAQAAPLLLLDEPTTGLDLGQQLKALELVDELRRAHGLTVLSTMHDLTLAGRFADRFALLSNGRLVAEGNRAEVLSTHVIAEHFGATVRIVDDDELGWVVVPISERER
jgi:iron complex transport system ATP-binding protein